ncbi:NADH-dependent FMN reductase [Lewinellaceae bacterium SD302]|nr:NADH-dependent FMN reductase [Lewinellaceae bacterium SD302]
MTSAKTSPVIDQALRNMTYGFYIVATRKDGSELTTRNEDWLSAGTVSWAIQSSFDPAMITIAIQKDSDLNETIGRSSAFSLTVLGKQDEKLVKKFANDTDVDYSNNKVNGISYTEGKTGAPILDCGLATIECKLVETLTPSGDHVLFVGKVQDGQQHERNDKPLTEADTRFEYGGTSN